jgi:hypothetical protein
MMEIWAAIIGTVGLCAITAFAGWVIGYAQGSRKAYDEARDVVGQAQSVAMRLEQRREL